MNYSEKTDLEKIYGDYFIDKKPEIYFPSRNLNSHYSPTKYYTDLALSCFKERLSIDEIIRELTFCLIALFTYLFMQWSGRIHSLKEFGWLIGFVLVFSMAYNLYKASFKSLAPGLICLVSGMCLLSDKLPHQYINFLSNNAIEYLIGFGALLIGFSLFKSSN